jgi:hypothetical protein
VPVRASRPADVSRPLVREAHLRDTETPTGYRAMPVSGNRRFSVCTAPLGRSSLA